MRSIAHFKKIIQSRFYHTMSVFIYETTVIDHVSTPVGTLFLKDVPCFLTRVLASPLEDNEKGNKTQYTAKIYYSDEVILPAGCTICVDILGEKRVFITSGEEILYPTHKEIYVKRKEYLS